jgi:hypothetical protein
MFFSGAHAVTSHVPDAPPQVNSCQAQQRQVPGAASSLWRAQCSAGNAGGMQVSCPTGSLPESVLQRGHLAPSCGSSHAGRPAAQAA